MHGYELRKRLSSCWARFTPSLRIAVPVPEGLLGRGLIAEDDPDPSPRARAGRRSRIVYRLTAEGKDRLHELLSEAGPDVVGRRRLRCALRLLRADPRRHPAAHPGRAPQPAGGADGGGPAAFARTRERVEVTPSSCRSTASSRSSGRSVAERADRPERQRDTGAAGQPRPDETDLGHRNTDNA